MRPAFAARVAFAAAFATALVAPRPLAAGEYVESSPRTADIVFATSRVDWRERREPPVVAYALTERYEAHGTPVALAWRATYRTAERCLTLRALPAASPQPAVAPAAPARAPYLVPDASFGVARRELAPALGDASEGTSCAPASASTPAPVAAASLAPSGDPSGARVREIVRVSATLHDYAIDFTNTEVVAGADCWHLTLRPRFDAARDRLREAWMSVGGSETIRLRVRGLFDVAPYDRATWTVDYALAGGTYYVRRIASDDALHLPGVEPATHVTFEFADYAFADGGARAR